MDKLKYLQFAAESILSPLMKVPRILTDEAWREQQILSCMALGATADDLMRHETAVKTLAQRTLYRNSDVWRSGWGYVQQRLALGQSVIPADPTEWADGLFAFVVGSEPLLRATWAYRSWMQAAEGVWDNRA